MPERVNPGQSSLGKAGQEQPAAEHSSEVLPNPGPGRYCAYNRTRERFLSNDVEAADFSATVLATRLPALTPTSGAALWIAPFRGISPTSMRVPIDLIFLSQDYVVLSTVESFPLSLISPSSSPADSVLALPAQTIASTATQSGDQLMLCVPDEMKRRLKLLETAKTPYAPATAASTSQAPAPGANLAQPAQKRTKPSRNWFLRLFLGNPPDPRNAPRQVLPGLIAYFFTGGAPVPHEIRDISRSGLYLYTAERWYEGTVIRLTLTDRRQPTVERSITVNTKVVRWGNDGVGLQFIVRNGKDQRRAEIPLIDDLTEGVSRKELDQFLDRLGSSAT
jgi:hypothetical protein